MNGVLLIAEADGEVGFGHLAELKIVASALRERGVAASRIGIGQASSTEPEVEWCPRYDAIIARLIASRPAVVAWSVRTTRWHSIWREIEALSTHHLWITDVADDYPAVDALVVPTLEPRWREAPTGTRVFSGPTYFPLDLRGPARISPLQSRTRDVLVTLGGADRTEASIRLVPALRGTRSTVVIGPAFRHRAGVERAAASAGIDVVVTPDGLRPLLLQHRLVISAGGNTLFEAAAAGTPALVAWEDPHEEAQGLAFARRGSARVLGRGADININDTKRTVTALLSSPDLDAMSAAGPPLVDGGGAGRIADLLLELAQGVAA
jgi:spore coat polysaccharide biosynthesis predicted glycosyltransferase SpsG